MTTRIPDDFRNHVEYKICKSTINSYLVAKLSSQYGLSSTKCANLDKCVQDVCNKKVNVDDITFYEDKITKIYFGQYNELRHSER